MVGIGEELEYKSHYKMLLNKKKVDQIEIINKFLKKKVIEHKMLQMSTFTQLFSSKIF